MGYEYKEEILLDIGPEPNCNYESESNRYYDKIDELDHVYAQSAKADEYEAKAKAFDAISYIIKKRANDDFSSVNNDYEAGILRAYEVMECNVDDFYRDDTDA